MKSYLLIFLFSSMLLSHLADAQKPDFQSLAAGWLYAARTDAPTDTFVQLLAGADRKALQASLNTDQERKTFWINVYNAITQTSLKAAPEKYANRNAFFKARLYTIAGTRVSLDLIEHGILRRSKNKLSLGYLNKWFPGNFEKDFRVDSLDCRIHFALNCGARSCPPIAYYKVKEVNEQLQQAMIGHLKAETDYDSLKNVAAVTAFMGWFRVDFGGKKGIRKLLHEAKAKPQNKNPRIVFKKYNWDIYLDNFKE